MIVHITNKNLFVVGFRQTVNFSSVIKYEIVETV